MSFKDDLAAARAAVPDTRLVEVSVGGVLHTLKVRAVPTTRWTAITGVHMPRPQNRLDMSYGYNWHSASDDAAAESVVRVEDGKDVPFERTPAVEASDGVEAVPAVDEWADLLEVISAPDLTVIRNAVWDLNEHAPGLRTQALKKASTVNSRKKRN